MGPGWMRRLDERSSYAEGQREKVAFFAPLSTLIAVGALVAAPFAFAMGPAGSGVFLLVLTVWSGLLAWAGWRIRRRD